MGVEDYPHHDRGPNSLGVSYYGCYVRSTSVICPLASQASSARAEVLRPDLSHVLLVTQLLMEAVDTISQDVAPVPPVCFTGGSVGIPWQGYE